MKKDEVRITDILYELIKHRILIVSLTIVGLLIGIVLSGISFLRGEMSKQYIITSSFSVKTQTDKGLFTSGQDFPDYDDVNMSEDLAVTVSYILKSDMVLENLINSLDLLGITTKDIYDNLSLQQYEETQVIEMNLYWRSADEGIKILSELNRIAPEILQETMNIGNIAILNQPASKYIIGGNINIVLWGYTALIGLALGVVITISKLFMRPTLINVKDVEKVYQKEVLCEIVADKAYFEKRRPILASDGISPEVRESFASAAHIINNRLWKKEGSRIIYVTSTCRGEGRTSVTANLAVQLSQLEKRVLLLDLDTRNPSIAGLFLKDVEYAHSLNAFYAGDISKAEAVVSLTGYLDIMPTILERETIPLDSNLFAVIKQIADDYDYILIDTAPVGLTADSMNLSQIASAALFVIRYDDATLKEIGDAIDRINKIGVDVLGCVINGVKVTSKGIHNSAKENDKLSKAEEELSKVGEPLVKLETPRTLENFDTGIDNPGNPLVTEFSENPDSTNETQQKIVTSSGDFIDRLFLAEDSQKTDSGAEKKN